MAAHDPNLKGVGGWLAFFLVTLGGVNPLVFMVTGYQALSDPALPEAYGAAWPALRTGEIALIAFVVAICWFACWRFLKIFNRTTVWIGIGTLWTLAPVAVFGEAFLVSRIAGLDFGDLLAASTPPELIRPFGYATIWTLYLLLSKRVRNTYGPRQGEPVGEVFQ